jgi:hypothetical protein
MSAHTLALRRSIKGESRSAWLARQRRIDKTQLAEGRSEIDTYDIEEDDKATERQLEREIRGTWYPNYWWRINPEDDAAYKFNVKPHIKAWHQFMGKNGDLRITDFHFIDSGSQY